VERDLIERACEGDESAYELVVREHQEAVFRLAYLFLGDANEAEDAAQETFIRAYRVLKTFDTSRPLRPWLLRMAANLARNRRRAAGRYFAALRRWVFAVPEPSLHVELESARLWEAQTLWEAMQRLNLKDQEVIYLRYFLELSVNETAEVLKVEAGTVKSRLSRALERLRGVVEQNYPLLYEGRTL
jgi:RNA polymerase sigma-70 factor (ECF subfamily)